MRSELRSARSVRRAGHREGTCASRCPPHPLPPGGDLTDTYQTDLGRAGRPPERGRGQAWPVRPPRRPSPRLGLSAPRRRSALFARAPAGPRRCTVNYGGAEEFPLPGRGALWGFPVPRRTFGMVPVTSGRYRGAAPAPPRARAHGPSRSLRVRARWGRLRRGAAPF